jgi:hypothetical protein
VPLTATHPLGAPIRIHGEIVYKTEFSDALLIELLAIEDSGFLTP